MYLFCPATTSFPAICGANYPTFVFLYKEYSYCCGLNQGWGVALWYPTELKSFTLIYNSMKLDIFLVK